MVCQKYEVSYKMYITGLNLTKWLLNKNVLYLKDISQQLRDCHLVMSDFAFHLLSFSYMDKLFTFLSRKLIYIGTIMDITTDF